MVRESSIEIRSARDCRSVFHEFTRLVAPALCGESQVLIGAPRQQRYGWFVDVLLAERHRDLSTRVAKSRVDLLEEIAPDVERLFNRHMEAPRLWFPHEQINWGEGEDFKERPWTPGGLSDR